MGRFIEWFRSLGRTLKRSLSIALTPLLKIFLPCTRTTPKSGSISLPKSAPAKASEPMLTRDMLPKILCHEAKRWLRMVERGGNNKGEIVQMFQKAVDDKAVGEPWCMSFVQFCVNQVISLAQELNLRVTSALPESEHCMTVWRLSPTQHKLFEPRPGYLVIWRLKTSHSGHTGVVVEIEKNAIWTVEGNTSPDDGGDQREGDGVFLKKRPRGGFGNFHEVGFIDPFS